MEPFRLLTVESVLHQTDRPMVFFPGLPGKGLLRPIPIGDKIELRRPDGTCISTTIAGIEHARKLWAMHPAPFKVAGNDRTDGPTGTEIWWISSEKP